MSSALNPGNFSSSFYQSVLCLFTSMAGKKTLWDNRKPEQMDFNVNPFSLTLFITS